MPKNVDAEKKSSTAIDDNAIRAMVYKTIAPWGISALALIGLITGAVNWVSANFATKAYDEQLHTLVVQAGNDRVSIAGLLAASRKLVSDGLHVQVKKADQPTSIPSVSGDLFGYSTATCPEDTPTVVGGGFVDVSGGARIVHS